MIPERRITTSSPTEPHLPALHRLAIVYLTLPLGIWLLGWFEWWFGVPATLLLIGSVWPSLRGHGSVLNRPSRVTILVALAALGWVMLTANGNLMDTANSDWEKHRFILYGLSEQPWPVRAIFPDGETQIMRYYLGWYLPPSAVSKLLGTWSLTYLVPLWTWAGIALILLMAAQGRRGLAIPTAIIICVLFGGMDLFRALFAVGLNRDWLLFAWSVEWSRESYFLLLLHPSFTFSLAGAPHHLISALLGALLLWQTRHANGYATRCVGPWLAGSLLWSPYSSLGLLPLLAGWMLAGRRSPRALLTWPNLAAAPLAAVTIIYLASGTDAVPWWWLFSGKEEVSLILSLTAVFIAAEFGGLVLVLTALDWRRMLQPMPVAAVATLLLLPLLGHGEHNDLVKRACMPSLAVLSLVAMDVLAEWPRWRSGGGTPRELRRTWFRRAGITALVLILCVGAFSALVEVRRAAVYAYPYHYADRDPAHQSIPAWLAYQNFTPEILLGLGALMRGES